MQTRPCRFLAAMSFDWMVVNCYWLAYQCRTQMGKGRREKVRWASWLRENVKEGDGKFTFP